MVFGVTNSDCAIAGFESPLAAISATRRSLAVRAAVPVGGVRRGRAPVAASSTAARTASRVGATPTRSPGATAATSRRRLG
jgi:hypothetical protein